MRSSRSLAAKSASEVYLYFAPKIEGRIYSLQLPKDEQKWSSVVLILVIYFRLLFCQKYLNMHIDNNCVLAKEN